MKLDIHLHQGLKAADLTSQWLTWFSPFTLGGLGEFLDPPYLIPVLYQVNSSVHHLIQALGCFASHFA